ncbi:MAG TPA: hypothetical protein VET89_09210 [Stellaceae bacterium]|nr:hypothetical protein [Stellaceae bacterium]
MATIRTDYATMPWAPGIEMYGQAALYEGKPILELKVLSDRRGEGGGVAYLLRATPPAGKLIKIVAVARSDEHVFNLSGNRANKSGKPVAAAGGYALNPQGQPHSAMIAAELTSLVVYAGEPDEIRSVEVLDLEAGGAQ